MERLINADMLKKQVCAIHNAIDASGMNEAYDTGFHSAASLILGLLEHIHTIDPVHAAGGCYCGECEWWYNDGPDGSRRCLMWGGLRDLAETDFCSSGQRKGY